MMSLLPDRAAVDGALAIFCALLGRRGVGGAVSAALRLGVLVVLVVVLVVLVVVVVFVTSCNGLLVDGRAAGWILKNKYLKISKLIKCEVKMRFKLITYKIIFIF